VCLSPNKGAILYKRQPLNLSYYALMMLRFIHISATPISSTSATLARYTALSVGRTVTVGCAWRLVDTFHATGALSSVLPPVDFPCSDCSCRSSVRRRVRRFCEKQRYQWRCWPRRLYRTVLWHHLSHICARTIQNMGRSIVVLN